MKALKLILGVLAVPAIFVTLVVLVNVYHVYVDPDPLEEVQRDTRRMLHDYEHTRDPRELRGMFAYPPDAACGTVAMMAVGEWAITHQKDFIYIIDGLHPGDDREVFVGVFTGAISQSDLGDEFEAAFRKYRSPVLDQIMGRTPSPAQRGKEQP